MTHPRPTTMNVCSHSRLRQAFSLRALSECQFFSGVSLFHQCLSPTRLPIFWRRQHPPFHPLKERSTRTPEMHYLHFFCYVGDLFAVKKKPVPAQLVQQLVAMGFEAETATVALRHHSQGCNPDLESVSRLLVQGGYCPLSHCNCFTV